VCTKKWVNTINIVFDRLCPRVSHSNSFVSSYIKKKDHFNPICLCDCAFVCTKKWVNTINIVVDQLCPRVSHSNSFVSSYIKKKDHFNSERSKSVQ
jgi:predicted transcriptional regulator